MSDLRRHALELCTRIELDHINSPTRAEDLIALCEALTDLARGADDRETIETWGDIFGFLHAQVAADVRRIAGA